MGNFDFNAKRRIRMARNRGQLEKTFDSICEECASKCLTGYRCDSCPIAGAYSVKKWAMDELQAQLRKLED